MKNKAKVATAKAILITNDALETEVRMKVRAVYQSFVFHIYHLDICGKRDYWGFRTLEDSSHEFSV